MIHISKKAIDKISQMSPSAMQHYLETMTVAKGNNKFVDKYELQSVTGIGPSRMRHLLAEWNAWGLAVASRDAVFLTYENIEE